MVGTFNTIPGEILFPLFEAKGKGGASPDLIYFGDDCAAKERVAELIRDVGFNPVDPGGLRTSRYMEPFGLVVSLLAYGGKDGPEMGYRFGRL